MSSFFHHESPQAKASNEYEEKKHHKAHLTHELIAGAAAYEGATAYEKHVAENGKPASHSKAKELLAGFTGAFVEREAETRGLDFIDKAKAKHEAKQHAEQNLSSGTHY